MDSPTQPHWSTEPTEAEPPPSWYDITPIPPPPPPEPKIRKYRWGIVALIVLLLGLVGEVVFAGWSAIHAPTVSPAQPTSDTSYTALDIVGHMQAIDKTVGIESRDKTLLDWSHNNYYISAHATSSIQFTGCPESCADIHHFGLWV